MNAALAGTLVADLTQNVAGPYCTQILGDLGADVVKVERVGRGDDARAWGPPFWGQESATFMAVNRNKRSLAVDLKSPEGIAVVERLLARADVFVQSLRAGAVEELGLGWARAAVLNPRLVYCSVTAFGTDGPLRDRPGYDPLMQAYSGIMSINGHPDQPPARVPISVVDMGTGMWAVMGIMAALRERDRTGRGAHVTTALFDTALANLEAGKCETFFDKQMSPNFRRTTGSRALRTLISSCESRESLRAQVMTAIKLAREGTPEFQYGGTRAVFDLEGSGLPYRQWVVERIDDKWYIAE